MTIVRAEWKKASQLIGEMQRKGLKPDRYSYTSAIHASAKAENPVEALRLLRAMETNGVSIFFAGGLCCLFFFAFFLLVGGEKHDATAEKAINRTAFHEEKKNSREATDIITFPTHYSC